MIGSKIGHSLDPLLVRVYQLFFRGKIVKPNLLTVIGLLFGFICLILTINNRLLLAGLALFISGFFDLLDGAVARQYGTVTAYGGFLDSVLDRYTDLSVALGIFIYFLRSGDDHLFAILTFVAAIGIAIVSYIRARAEAASLQCKSGLLERPERTILLIIGLCFNSVCLQLTGLSLLKPVIVLLAVLTHLTAIQRILMVRKAARN
ncbi:MAG TPA: CDP-alcohol phosphatidyltransferase family protein [Syntrophorhabdales bacterium]|nr:CDP-alcohol phosphatidyltransferase family protein [Syntrophorhabdales bacterium]